MTTILDNRLRAANIEHRDVTVRLTREQSVTVSAPGKRHPGRETSLVLLLLRREDLLLNALVLQIPNLDGLIRRSDQPVVLRGEGKVVDRGGGVQGVQVLAIVDIPEHGGTVLTSRRAEGTVRRDGDRVDRGAVAREVVAELAVVQVPHLDELVPTARNDQWLLGRRREAHAAHPVGVGIIGDGVLALSEGVPQTDGLITGTRDDLTIVGRERDGVNIAGVALEGADRGTDVQIVQAHGLVPGRTEGELTIGGADDILDSLIVSSEGLLGETWLVLVRGELPDHDGLITGGRDDHVGVVEITCDAGDPIAVTLELTNAIQRISGHS